MFVEKKPQFTCYQEYLNCLNEFRTSLPARLSHIEPVSAQDSAVRNAVNTISAQYRDILNRANVLADRLSGVGGRQREYRDALDKAKTWMRDAEPRANKVLILFLSDFYVCVNYFSSLLISKFGLLTINKAINKANYIM